eukprot:2832848-Prymnesium_polylepis.1
MLPSGVAETTGEGGGWCHAAWDDAANARTTDGSGCRRCEFRTAGAEWQQWLFVRHSRGRVTYCGGSGCGAARMLPSGVAETTGGGGGWWHATREGAAVKATSAECSHRGAVEATRRR